MSKKVVNPGEVNPDLLDVSGQKEEPTQSPLKSQGISFPPLGQGGRNAGDSDVNTCEETDLTDVQTENSRGVVDDTDVIDYGEGENTTVDSDTSVNESDDEEMVELFISNLESSDTKISISINLITFEIPVGEAVMVPKYVRDYWRTLSKQKANFNNKANSMVYDN